MIALEVEADTMVPVFFVGTDDEGAAKIASILAHFE